MQLSLVFAAVSVAAALMAAPSPSNHPAVAQRDLTKRSSSNSRLQIRAVSPSPGSYGSLGPWGAPTPRLLRRATAETQTSQETKCFLPSPAACDNTYGSSFNGFNLNDFKFKDDGKLLFPDFDSLFPKQGFGTLSDAFSGLALLANSVGAFTDTWHQTGTVDLPIILEPLSVFAADFHAWSVSSLKFNNLGVDSIKPYANILGAFIANVQTLFSRIDQAFGIKKLQDTWTMLDKFKVYCLALTNLFENWQFTFETLDPEFKIQPQTLKKFGLPITFYQGPK